MNNVLLRDPTAETAPLKRARRKPAPTLEGMSVGLLDIGKTRSDEFLDRIAAQLVRRGVTTKRYRKPTNTKTAPLALLHQIAAEVQGVVIALSD